MRSTAATLALFLGLLWLACSVPAQSQTQHQMNREAEEGYRRADLELNRVYRALLPRLPAAVREKLVDAQLAWIKFRDAEAEAHAWEFEGGSMYPFLYFASLEHTTKERTQDLRAWLESLSPGGP